MQAGTATPLPPDPNDALACYTDNPMNMLDGCALPQITDALGGEATFGLIIGGAMIATMWRAGGGYIGVPAVLTILFGGLLMPILPSDYQGMAYSIIIVGIAAAAWAVQQNRGGGRF